MPSSYHYPITLTIEHIVRLRPKSILDVGPGYGKWGFLMREALDFVEGRYSPDSWKTEIVGIDGFRHQSPLLDWAYNRVLVDDIRNRMDFASGFDMVVLGDVIEHFEKDEGRQLLSTLLSTNRNVLVITPLHYFEQGSLEDNPFEIHRSHWRLADFDLWTSDYDVIGDSVVALMAGVAASYPIPRAHWASRVAYSLPGVRRRPALARLFKAVLAGL